jgi:hypothetical protein
MLVSEAIRTTNKLYSTLNYRNFQQKVGAESYKVWCYQGKNIINFLAVLPTEFKDRFWNWLTSIGVVDLEQIRRIYAILNILYSKKNQLPKNLKYILSRHHNFAVFIGVLGPELISDICNWAETNLTEQEQKIAQGSFSLPKLEQEKPVQNEQQLFSDTNIVSRKGFQVVTPKKSANTVIPQKLLQAVGDSHIVIPEKDQTVMAQAIEDSHRVIPQKDHSQFALAVGNKLMQQKPQTTMCTKGIEVLDAIQIKDRPIRYILLSRNFTIPEGSGKLVKL